MVSKFESLGVAIAAVEETEEEDFFVDSFSNNFQ